MKKSPKICVHHLKKSFGDKKVLKGVDLEIAEGESMVILGGSGSGKSVLIKSICTLLDISAGSIEIDGREVTRLSSRQQNHLMKKIGYLFQGGALFDSLTVWQNVAFRLINSEGVKKSMARDIAIKKLSDVGLEKRVADLYPSEISGGMQKRVSLARAVATDPEIIFFDEPTTGLDPIMSDVVNDLIIKNSKMLGATTVTITHDMASANKIADRVAMLYDGKIIWCDKKSKLKKSDNKFVDQFINGKADGPINFLSGKR
tara:strand:- start:7061 stop:7837 length:777 start_codon:yes stop_codon:yes gene_type:complete